MGTINGVPAHEYSIETTEEKPWLKPGADITGKIYDDIYFIYFIITYSSFMTIKLLPLTEVK